MKRDMGLIAKILRFIEVEGIPGQILNRPAFEVIDQKIRYSPGTHMPALQD